MGRRAPGLVTILGMKALLRARAGVLGTAALAAGVVSHVAGGGRLPGLLVLALLLAVSVFASGLLLRVRATPGRLVAMVVGGQTLVHVALSVVAGHRDGAARAAQSGVPDIDPVLTAMPGARTGSLRDFYAASVPPPPAPGAPSSDGWLTSLVAHQVDHLVAQGALMVLAHLAGAVALGLFLAVGETALWRLVHLVAARALVVRARWRLLLSGYAARSGAVVRRIPAMSGLPLRGPRRLDHPTVQHRGPPHLLAA